MYLEVANYFGDLGSISCSWEVEASYPCSHVCFSHVVYATGLRASSSNPDSTGARERVVRKPKALAKRRFHHGWWMLKGPEELPIGGLCVRLLSSPFSASLLPSLLLYLFFPLSFLKNRISIGIWDCCALVFAILLSQYLFFFSFLNILSAGIIDWRAIHDHSLSPVVSVVLDVQASEVRLWGHKN